jgi:hypothetical protein
MSLILIALRCVTVMVCNAFTITILAMYNKLFTTILDSSIWLEDSDTVRVWITLLASMDEDGFCKFGNVKNLAIRANVPLPATIKAVDILESPDEYSPGQELDGRRIERVVGGWMVLNATKYRDMVTRRLAKEQNRVRVARHRERKRSGPGPNVGVWKGEDTE